MAIRTFDRRHGPQKLLLFNLSSVVAVYFILFSVVAVYLQLSVMKQHSDSTQYTDDQAFLPPRPANSGGQSSPLATNLFSEQHLIHPEPLRRKEEAQPEESLPSQDHVPETVSLRQRRIEMRIEERNLGPRKTISSAHNHSHSMRSDASPLPENDAGKGAHHARFDVLLGLPVAVRKKRPFPWISQRGVPKLPVDLQTETEPPMDPLGPHFDVASFQPLNLTLKTKHLGVLLDAGRHYFQLDWIRRMIDMLSILQYNLLHFRLTDDQAFNIRLDSHPELAYPVQLYGNNQTYTPQELRDLVAYAKTRNITIIPEINVPGHAGAWAGIPGLIVECPQFICDKGYGVPLNIANPNLRPVLTDVLREVIDIFDNPPFLHLGGDEVHMSEPCFREARLSKPNYLVFENMLQEILQDIQYPSEQVIRWEITSRLRHEPERAGGITQFWFDVPGERKESKDPFFASKGLYFDSNREETAWEVFLNTRRYYHLNRGYYPLGIVAGTFELDSRFWYDRNVVGRLLAVTMGASDLQVENGSELYTKYRELCQQVGFQDELCRMYGKNILPQKQYLEQWKKVVWKEWKFRICDRLTHEVFDRAFLNLRKVKRRVFRDEFREGNTYDDDGCSEERNKRT